MNMICYHCGHMFNRDLKIGNKVIEEYSNVFGTICPNCEKRIEPFDVPFFIKDNIDKMDRIRMQFRDKLRKKIIGECDGDRKKESSD